MLGKDPEARQNYSQISSHAGVQTDVTGSQANLLETGIVKEWRKYLLFVS